MKAIWFLGLLMFISVWGQGPDEAPSGEPPPDAEVRVLPHPPQQEVAFWDGDWIRGTLTGMADGHVHLQLAWGDEVRIPLGRIARIEHMYDNLLIDGILQLEDWVERPQERQRGSPPPQDRVDEVYFPSVPNYTLMMPTPPLPDRFLLEIRFQHQVARPNIRFGMLPHREARHPELHFVMSQIGERLLFQQSITENVAGSNWNRPQPQGLPRRQTYRFYFDQERERLAMFLNEHAYEEWAFSRAVRTPIGDTAVFFVTQNALDPFAVERFRIRHWNGLLPDVPAVHDQPLLILQNGDVIAGTWTAFEAGRFVMEVAGGHRVPIPVQVLDELRFPPNALEEDEEGDVATVSLRSRFSGIRMRVHGLEETETHVRGRSPNLADPLAVPNAFFGGMVRD